MVFRKSKKQLLQISTDNPNVNWTVLGLISEGHSKQEFPYMINIGSCGLHKWSWSGGLSRVVYKHLSGTLQKFWTRHGNSFMILLHEGIHTFRFVKSKIFRCGMFVWQNALLSVVVRGYINFDFRLLYLFWDFINCSINWGCSKLSLYP